MDKKTKKIIEAIESSRVGSDAERELEATIRAVDFAHKNKVDVVIAPESNARGGALFFRDVYAKRYPGEIVPTAVFVNFRNVNSPAKLQEHFPRLVAELKKGKKAFVFDSCMHTGGTMDKTREVIDPVSKKKVLRGVMNNPAFRKSDSLKKLDFVGKTSLDYCSFFHRINMGMMRSDESVSPYGKVMNKNLKLISEDFFEKILGKSQPVDYRKTRERMKKLAEKTPAKRRRVR